VGVCVMCEGAVLLLLRPELTEAPTPEAAAPPPGGGDPPTVAAGGGGEPPWRAVDTLARDGAVLTARVPRLGRSVAATMGALGVAPHSRPALADALVQGVWERWREAAAVIARSLPVDTRAERALSRAAWRAIDAADAAWESAS